LQVSQTDRNIYFAIIDKNHLLRYAMGASPYVSYIRLCHLTRVADIYAKDDNTYGVFLLPFSDSAGRTVGTIHTVAPIPFRPRLLLHDWTVNCLFSAFLAFIGTVLGIPYIGEK
jgi:hypothetical protein